MNSKLKVTNGVHPLRRTENGRVTLDGTIAELVSDDPMVIKNPKGFVHKHTYGGLTPFFRGLAEGKLLGTRIPRIKIPAKVAPLIVRDIATYYKDNRQDQESFNQILDRVGVADLTAVAAQAQKVAESAEAGSDLYIDWERTNQYVLERGEGECAV